MTPRTAWADARTGPCNRYQLAEMDRGGMLVVERHGQPCQGGRVAVAHLEAMARREGPVTA